MQVSQIFVNQILFNVVWLLYCLKQPCCKTSCEVNSSPSINTNVHIQAFKVWEPHLFKCVCVCMSLGVCVCAFVRVCALAFTLAHKRIHECKLFLSLRGFVVICCWKKTHCSSKGQPLSGSDL